MVGKKKIAIIGILMCMTTMVGCDNGEYKKGDILYGDNFEIIRKIDDTEKIYEVRDKQTGVHYILNWYDDNFSPYYNKKGEIKTTKINEKYKEE